MDGLKLTREQKIKILDEYKIFAARTAQSLGIDYFDVTAFVRKFENKVYRTKKKWEKEILAEQN